MNAWHELTLTRLKQRNHFVEAACAMLAQVHKLDAKITNDGLAPDAWAQVHQQLAEQDARLADAMAELLTIEAPKPVAAVCDRRPPEYLRLRPSPLDLRPRFDPIPPTPVAIPDLMISK